MIRVLHMSVESESDRGRPGRDHGGHALNVDMRLVVTDGDLALVNNLFDAKRMGPGPGVVEGERAARMLVARIRPGIQRDADGFVRHASTMGLQIRSMRYEKALNADARLARLYARPVNRTGLVEPVSHQTEDVLVVTVAPAEPDRVDAFAPVDLRDVMRTAVNVANALHAGGRIAGGDTLETAHALLAPLRERIDKGQPVDAEVWASVLAGVEASLMLERLSADERRSK